MRSFFSSDASTSSACHHVSALRPEASYLILSQSKDAPAFSRVRDACPDLGIDVQPLVYAPVEIDEMLASGNSFLETALSEGVVAYERGATGTRQTKPAAVPREA